MLTIMFATVNDKVYREAMKSSFDLIVARKSNYTQEAKKFGISDNGLRKRFASLGLDIKKTSVIHHGRVTVKCSYCQKAKDVEHNDLKDYRYGGLKKALFCDKTCHAEYMRSTGHTNDPVYDKVIKYNRSVVVGGYYRHKNKSWQRKVIGCYGNTVQYGDGVGVGVCTIDHFFSVCPKKVEVTDKMIERARHYMGKSTLFSEVTINGVLIN